ncbi:hypothetical protein CDCA_CDCA03G1042 [Cyanidium caldarium]|uniref:Elongin-C n=1 Tax=Cyanidium caldarium TaxID=2771 RepID=A0AAV9IRP1_CYACA|nr:hypothetical protein CDCA_CDCA03G1042 [Cyanidium caldarium]
MHADYVKLVANDGRAFYVRRHCAEVSGTIRSMLLVDCVESRRGEVVFAQIDSDLLEHCCDYFYYRRQCEEGAYGTELPTFPVPLEASLRLLTVANYLNV